MDKDNEIYFEKNLSCILKFFFRYSERIILKNTEKYITVGR